MSDTSVKSKNILEDSFVATAVAEYIDQNIQENLEEAGYVKKKKKEQYETFNVFRRLAWIRKNAPDN